MNGDLRMMSWILVLDLDVLTIDTVCGALVVPTVTSPKSSPTRADELATALLAPARISKSSDCARAGPTNAARINSSEKLNSAIGCATDLSKRINELRPIKSLRPVSQHLPTCDRSHASKIATRRFQGPKALLPRAIDPG
jgi:hypothetical protein